MIRTLKPGVLNARNIGSMRSGRSVGPRLRTLASISTYKQDDRGIIMGIMNNVMECMQMLGSACMVLLWLSHAVHGIERGTDR